MSSTRISHHADNETGWRMALAKLAALVATGLIEEMKRFMSNPSLRFASGSLLLAVISVGAGVGAAKKEAVIKGAVVVDGPVPAPRKFKLEDAMRRLTGDEYYVEETWLVGERKGLANCVITLKPKTPANRVVTKPLEKLVLDKVGVRYVPRVLVVTPGTQVVFRNQESPCRGFTVTGRKPLAGNHANFYIAPGGEEKAILKGPDICSLSCPVRPYAKGYIHVVDTPYFAVTDSRGSFRMPSVPAGEYQVTAWHAAAGRLTEDAGPMELIVDNKNEYTLTFRVTPPEDGKK
jgi:hypothetical protein